MKENEIPHIEYQSSTLKEKILALVLVAVYWSQLLIDKVIPKNATRSTILAIVIIYYVLALIVAIICFMNTLKRDTKIFISNASAYLKYIIPRYVVAYTIFVLCNGICLTITKQVTSVNQAAINSLPLWFVIPIAIIWAPIVEETLYRGVLRRYIKNNAIFVTISTIIFALVHTINEESIFNLLIMMIPYAILGGLFGYVYAKTNNIISNIILHFLQNAIAIILSIMLLYS